jgi:chromosomal replication initiation ATPase DnaA
MTDKEFEKIIEVLDNSEINEPKIIMTNYSDKLSMDYTEKDPSTNTNSASPAWWGKLQDEEFVPAFESVDKVPSGIYEIVWNRQLSQHTIKKQPFKTDELYQLPSYEIQDILKDIQNFWDRRDKYREYNFVHKRGILMYGEPGCGKSGIIQLISKQLIENDGIILNIKNNDDVEYFIDFIATFRKIEPNRPLIVLLEDIDSIAGENNHSTSKLLNILDGVKQIEDVVYIATTNYPEKLQERITNRPSRFDRRYKVELPNEEIREAYIRHKLKDEDLKNVNISEWVKRTEGMSLSHLKEVVISTIVMGKEFEEVMDNLEGLKKTPKIKGSGILGFGRSKD